MLKQQHATEQNTIAFDKLDDRDLISYVQEGNSQALDFLIRKYRGFVRAKASTYFLIGADHEDIVQEGMIGLYKAIRDYRNDRRSSFRAFAELCVTRQIITAIKTATRQKHIPLNSYVSLDKPIFDEDSERTLLDVLANVEVEEDPESLVINQESYGQVEGELFELLSPLEKNVLLQYLDGRTYQEMSAELNRHVKSIDNALQRVKRKLERFMHVSEIQL
ncbi:RNA polymerase, sigma 30 subunit, SigH [Pelagirhabdus alkalitolerans]|uniref:RNA polymerase sigma factor SigS n=1 Tax=Pelagirhabdus alkalitolerans TaxID=1612202 RepID=A0A1G6MB14_9BACI|nr:RNA polymerase sporulation sigma factor SigH [Pelagirhabdus alkalitolerans]SDC52650.1 RNA polymerase, sigma 30 subunit, SigH [Pelagirhabdus alkalitolerans]